MPETFEIDTQWFRTRLAEVGKTQSDLARFLEVDKASVSNLLRGLRPVKVTEIQPIARFLGVHPAAVMRAIGIEA